MTIGGEFRDSSAQGGSRACVAPDLAPLRVAPSDRLAPRGQQQLEIAAAFDFGEAQLLGEIG